MREYFQDYYLQTSEAEEYLKFQRDNPWLLPYALFKSIKSHCGWKSWLNWPEEIRNPTPEAIQNYQKKYETEIAYHTFIQYHCFKQMLEVKKVADELGIFLKGDLPILLDRESADVWYHRSLFNLDLGAGAPPDAYSSTGQNWGFPLYRWDVLEKQDYRWWKDRLDVAARIYHIYRLDHIIGFFRIWGIPPNHPATEGKYYPETVEDALQQGREILKMMLESSHMLPIGEDLGMVLPEVRQELAKMGICGMAVMRWERYWNSGGKYIEPADYPPLSMTTVSTHDSSPLQLWWKEDSQAAKDYALSQGWTYTVPLPKEYQFALLYTSFHTASLFHLNLLQEHLALFPEMVSLHPSDERINVPGIIADTNWSYRFRPTLEAMIAHEDLNAHFYELLAAE